MIIIEETKNVNQVLTLFDMACKTLKDVNDSKYLHLHNNKFFINVNNNDLPNYIHLKTNEEKNKKAFDFIKDVEDCVFNIEDYLTIRGNKADKIIKIEFNNSFEEPFVKFTRSSDIIETPEFIPVDVFMSNNCNEKVKELIDYYDSTEVYKEYTMSEEMLLKIKEKKPSEYFKVIFLDDEIVLTDPYNIIENSLTDIILSKQFLKGLEYKTTTKNKVKTITCPEVKIGMYVAEDEIHENILMLKFSVFQDKIIAKQKFLLYNI